MPNINIGPNGGQTKEKVLDSSATVTPIPVEDDNDFEVTDDLIAEVNKIQANKMETAENVKLEETNPKTKNIYILIID